MKRVALIACCIWLACPAAATAHRLDEYLQATRIALSDDAVRVEIDLTPGIGVLSRVVGLIDSDGDGALSLAEQRAYSTLVVSLTNLSVDGTAAPLVLARSDYPTLDDMRAGVGTIRLAARATLPASSSWPGRHQLTYVNTHQSDMSAYLVNALTPPARIQITHQERDPWQHHLTFEYTVHSPYARAVRVATGIGGAALFIGALAWFRRSGEQFTASRSHL